MLQLRSEVASTWTPHRTVARFRPRTWPLQVIPYHRDQSLISPSLFAVLLCQIPYHSPPLFRHGNASATIVQNRHSLPRLSSHSFHCYVMHRISILIACGITSRRSTVVEFGSGLRAYTVVRSAMSLGVRANKRMGTCPW